jgi:hypothetical protein
MNWVALLENPQAVGSLFAETATFSHVELHEVIVAREGPVLRLRFDVSAVPSPLPARWPEGSNTTQFIIAAWGVADVELVGWGSSVSGELNVSRSGERIHLQFAGSACGFKASCIALRVERLSGYVNGNRG